MQLVQNVASDSLRGSRGQGHEWNIGELLFEHAELVVVRPEVVSPLADAVHLVYYEPRQVATGVQDFKGVHELRGQAQLLRGHVEQLQVRGHVVELPVHRVGFRLGEVARHVHCGYLSKLNKLVLFIYITLHFLLC